MLNKDIKRKIDNSRNILVGQLPLPSDQIELITVTLIFKFMNDIDEQSRSIGGEISFFKDDLKEYTWQGILSNQLSADVRVTKFIHAIETVAKAKHIPELFKSIFRNTFLKFRDGKILKRFLDEINGFEYSHSEELGNAFEYLLSSMGAQGENGQFRTPRNIIDFITEVVDPDKEDKILDPACGTAGFLISAYKHILRKYTTGYENYRISLNNYETEGISIHWGDKLSQTDKEKLSKRIEGYDITPLMVRLSQVNMYLHHFPNPKIHDYDTLSNKNRWEDKYDCILANPPFMTPKGGVEPHSDFRIRAKKAEVLFSDYIIEHLTPNGKAGWIVPEGIIFQNSGDYVELRKWLINDMGLWAVVSLPAQIFQPYSGVKTTILLVDRALARTTQNIILVKVDNDGFSLNTNRTPIKDNDLPEALNLLTEYKKNPNKFEENKEAYKNEHKIKFTILSRKDFARIDSYKAATTGWDFYKRAFKQYLNAKETYEEKIAEEKDDNKIKRFEASFKKQKLNFLEVTGSGVVPATEEKLKEEFEKQFKEEIISYGDDSENSVKLTSEVKNYLDNEREFNLSVERYNHDIKNISDYEFVSLSEIANYINGFPFKPTDWEVAGTPIIRIQNLTKSNSEFNYTTRKDIPEKYKVRNGDLLISWSATIGFYIWNGNEAWLNQHIFNVNINEKKILKKYLFYLGHKIIELINSQTHGNTMKHITKDKFDSIKIPLPPIEIQQKIVDEIEGYQKVIDGCNLIIENFKPTFKIDLSWERVKLEEVCSLITDGTHLKPNYITEGVVFLSSKNVMKQKIDWDNVKYISNKDHAKLIKRAKPQLNDILLSKNGVNSGIAAIVENDSEFSIYVSLALLRPKPIIDPYYLLRILNTNETMVQFKSRFKGIGVPNLHLKEIKEVEIPLPPLKEQIVISNELQHDFENLENTVSLKQKMGNKIKEVIDGVWGKSNDNKNSA